MEQPCKRRKLSLKNKKENAPESSTSVTRSDINIKAGTTDATLELRKKLHAWRLSQRPSTCDLDALPDLPDIQEPISAQTVDIESPEIIVIGNQNPMIANKHAMMEVSGPSYVSESTITSCPVCLFKFPIGVTQLDSDTHIASCYQESMLDW